MYLTPSLDRCFPHLVNVAVQAILKMITNVSHGHDDAVFEGSSSTRTTTFSEALVRDPIACARAIVRACRASGQRREQLSQIIMEGNTNKTFGPCDAPVQVRDLALLRDVDTRWDSVYLMIRRLRVLRPVCVCVPKGKRRSGLTVHRP